MMPFVRFVPLILLLFSCQNMVEKPDPKPLHADMLPANLQPSNAQTNSVNCWVERGRFFVAGACYNANETWQKIWLDIHPLDEKGRPLSIMKHASVIVPTFSDAVPPYGRTSFFTSWPLTDFSGTPFACDIKIAGAMIQKEGPILVAPTVNSVKMFSPSAPGQPAQEGAWQVSGTVSNPLTVAAVRPRFEVLIFGTDNQLWFSTVLDPNDPAVKQVFHFLEREGPLQPKEDRYFNIVVAYQALPVALQEKKIGHVEVLPFEAR